jgi:hypothetical protein
MRKLLAALLAIFGVSSAAQPPSKVEMVDAKSIRYTMPTVAADSLEFTVPTRKSFEGAPQFHEDEWAQLEFFPKSRLDEIKKLLAEYKLFEKAHRGQYGWDQIYARRITRHPIIFGPGAADRLASALDAIPANAPILLTSSSALGQVKGGFTVPLAPKINLYGLNNESGITVLGAHLDSGADDLVLTKAFAKLSAAYDLIFVDWRNQMVLVGVNSNGDVDVWRP